MEIKSILIGIALATLYVLSGFIFYLYALKKRTKGIAKLLLISIFGRLIMVCAILFLLIKYLNLEIATFLISFAVSFLVLQTIELIGLNKNALKGV